MPVPADLPVRQEQAEAGGPTRVQGGRMSDSVSIEQLCDRVRRLLPLRSRLVGRERLNDLVMISVQEWPCESLLNGEAYHEILMERTRKRVVRTYEALHGDDQKYGALWEFVVSAVASAILQHILEWWWEKRSHRVCLAGWQKAMAKS